MTSFWNSIDEPTLHQGDLLPDCLIPEFADTFGHEAAEPNTIYTDLANLIVLSQTCDLAHGRLSLGFRPVRVVFAVIVIRIWFRR